ncbi:MAG: hypothetical protein Q9184_003018 [Pyrenodesmia sp. 2 TL-2023]
MSDNLAASQQQAVTQEDQPAEKMAQLSAEHTDGSNSVEEEEHRDEDAATDEQKEDAAEALAAVADAIKAGKGTKSTKATKTSPKKRATAGSDDQDESPKKKRATAGNDDKDGSPKKKRTPAKGKAVKSKVKVEDDEVEVEGTTSGGTLSGAADVTPEGSGADEDQVPVTPMKAKRSSAAATPRTPKTPKNPTATKQNDGTPTPKTKATPRKRSFADKVADKVSLPTSWAAAGDADKELVAMKKDGKSWNDIRAMWLEKTGQETATSTLPNRYKRLQLVMMQLDGNEVSPSITSPSTNSSSSTGSFAQLAVIGQLLNSCLLISLTISSLHPRSLTSSQKTMLQATKDEVEANWKNSKWALIATEMEKKGANKYPAEFLMKEWKKIEATRAAAAAAAADAAANAATAAGGNALLAAAQLAVGNTDEEDENEGDEVEE